MIVLPDNPRVVFKNQDLLVDWCNSFFRSDLRMIADYAGGLSMRLCKKPLFVTSIFRPDDDGVHGLWRGLDSRQEDGAGVMYVPYSDAVHIASVVNAVFAYGTGQKAKDFKVALVHQNRGAHGYHTHFQAPAVPMFIRLRFYVDAVT